MKHFFFFIVFFSFTFVFAQDKKKNDYDALRKKYEQFGENDSRAFVYLNQYIKKAKSEKKLLELFQGYRDAVYYCKSTDQRLKYTDSCIDAAYQSSDEDRISTAYILKGSIYYAKQKKYKSALDEYLMAYKYSKNTSDLYLKNKVSYHLGVVKNYLGYYDEALELFKDCTAYFEVQANDKQKHPFQVFNNQKGYLNSLHQMVICYRNLKFYKEADSIISIGLLKTFNNKDFTQERGYFLKCKGLSEYNNTRYQSAINLLQESSTMINDDFAWKSVGYFYIGKSYKALNNEDLAISNFIKIDSIFNKHGFILPELRENYELLINYYKKNSDREKQLYYTTQLLKADSIISRDFSYISPKMHREYDTNSLIEQKGKLEKATTWGGFLILCLVMIATGLVLILIKRYKREKNAAEKYILLEEKLRTEQYSAPNNTTAQKNEAFDDKKSQITQSLKEDLLRKLKHFEDKKLFTQKGLTIHKLAIQFETNSNYLSHVINEQKGMNFNRYLGDLRIRHITYLLFEQNIYLNYTIETLAKECGIASRQNFSDLFYEINGIRPTDFIKKRKKEIASQSKS